MKKPLLSLALPLLAASPLLVPAAQEGTVVTYPAPAGETLSDAYEVWAGGQKVDVHAARVLDEPFAGKEWDYGGPYSFAGFDMAGRVEVRIAAKRSLRGVEVLPASAGIRPTIVDDSTVTFVLDRPRKLSIEPEGKKGPLLLFADPPVGREPKPGEPGVVFFGPGIHEPDRIELGTGQILWIAGGAVVKAEVLARGERIRIGGRGILDGSKWPWRKGPVGNLIAIRNSTDVLVQGLTLRGSSHWTIVPSGSRRVTIENVKLCNSRVQNDDGINPCNSREVRITDCFIRSDDDCVALKGLEPSLGDVEDIVVENSVLWCDRARIFLLGHESRAGFMRRVALRNLDIIHFSMTPFLLEPGEEMRLEDVTVEDVRIRGEGQRELARLRPTVNQYMRKQVPGSIRNVRFRNVVLDGKPGEYLIGLEGADADHAVRDVSFEDVRILGEPISEKSGRLKVGKHVEGLKCASLEVLFDFEREEDIAAWKVNQPESVRLGRSPRFATSGGWSLRLSSPAWKAGMAEWPSFEARPPVADWRPFDRLVLDVTNPGRDRPFLALFASDDKVPFREALFAKLDVPSMGWRRFVISLAALAEKKVDLSRMSIIHIFGERPAADVEFFIDRVALLRPGEEPGIPGPAFAPHLAPLIVARAADLDRVFSKVMADAEGSPKARSIAGRLASGPHMQAGGILVEAAEGLPDVPRLVWLQERLDAHAATAARVAETVGHAKKCEEAGALPSEEVLIGTATSMEKVLPRHGPIALSPTKSVEVSLARNEKESVQIGIIPVGRDLEGVVLAAGDLRSEAGDVLPAAAVRCDVVGYVETKTVPPYGSPHVGWWPDPILDFLGPIRIAAGDVQCFWVRVCAPKEQKPGRYRGELTLTAKDLAAIRIPFSVRVRPFALPGHSPLPLAVTFGLPLEEEYSKMLRRVAAGPEWASSLKFAWADFLADYLISWDHLYRHGPPDFEVLERLHGQGRLGAFNLGNCSVGRGPGGQADPAAVEAMLKWAKEARAEAERRGILDHAYIYGFDEAPAEWFPAIEETAAALKRELPGVLTLTTAYDGSYGMKTVMKSIDAWTPLTAAYSAENAAAARAEGKRVWWYICCGPHHPHANMFVEYPAVEGRLLMGAMTAKFRPDGFLYYQISIWRPERPIESGPFTDWNPMSWTTYHGDGSWTCMGPGGRPVPTVRLENFRDGLEDFTYVKVLEEAVRRKEVAGPPADADRRWLGEARAALAVPETLVKSLTEYSRDPKELLAWRDRIADLIEASGIAGIDPWPRGFSLR